VYRIMLSSFPFSQIGNIIQKKLLKKNTEGRIFYLAIPKGCIGFLYYIGVDLIDGISWTWKIDDEIIFGEIGSIQNPAYYNPPFLVRKYVELKAENNTDSDCELRAYCDGICYEEGILREEKEEEITTILKDIREKLYEERTVGKSFDMKVEVTDKIKMLYNEKSRGLNWTACTITNAGNSNIYFCVNEWKRPEAPLEPNLTANIDLGKKNAIKKIYLFCDKGESSTAYIRVLK